MKLLYRILRAIVGGDTAHDAADSGNPVKMGFKAESTTPAAVADGDRSDWAGTLYGAGFVNPVTSAGAQVTGATGAAVPAGAIAMGVSDGTNLDMLRAIDSIAADGITAPTSGNLSVAAFMFADNGTTKDRWRSNTESTLLVSAARTVTTVTATQTNYNGRGLTALLHVSAKAAATTLTVYLQELNVVTGLFNTIAQSTAFAASAGSAYVVAFGPGIVSADYPSFGIGRSVYVPRTYVLVVEPSDANSVTYSLTGAVNV